MRVGEAPLVHDLGIIHFLFVPQIVDRPAGRQIALIFLPMIEHIKFYHVGYLTIFVLEKSEAFLIKTHLFPIIHKICWKMLFHFP